MARDSLAPDGCRARKGVRTPGMARDRYAASRRLRWRGPRRARSVETHLGWPRTPAPFRQQTVDKGPRPWCKALGPHPPMPYGPTPVTDPVLPGALQAAPQKRRAVAVREFGQITAVEVTGSLAMVLDDVQDALLGAFAGDPQAVVCDLSGAGDCAGPRVVDALAEVGSFPRDWPAVPVALVSPDERLLAALRPHPAGRYLVGCLSLQGAFVALRPAASGGDQAAAAPHPTAGRAARLFVARSCLDWAMTQGLAGACLVAGELVTNSIVRTGADIEVSVARHERLLRICVRDQDISLDRADDPTTSDCAAATCWWRASLARGGCCLRRVAAGWSGPSSTADPVFARLRSRHRAEVDGSQQQQRPLGHPEDLAAVYGPGPRPVRSAGVEQHLPRVRPAVAGSDQLGRLRTAVQPHQERPVRNRLALSPVPAQLLTVEQPAAACQPGRASARRSSRGRRDGTRPGPCGRCPRPVVPRRSDAVAAPRAAGAVPAGHGSGR